MAVENLKDEQLKALQQAEGYKQGCVLIELLEKSGFEAYFVGGCVRDVLIGRELKDFDMCTSARPEDMKCIFSEYKILLQGEAFGTVSVMVDGKPYEITTYRGDGAYKDLRRPDSVEFKKSLEEDLKRRDFTVNALAFHPKKGLVDFVGGLKDIKLKKLKTVGDPIKRFQEDALRIARLIRFSIQLGFDVDEKSLSAARQEALSLKSIAKERVFTEFKKMLADKPNINILDQVFKTKFCNVLVSGSELNIFEKAFVAFKLSKALEVDIKDYVLEKNIRDRALSFEKLSVSTNIKTDFIKACDKFSLFGQEQLNFWTLIQESRSDVSGIPVNFCSKEEVLKATKELKVVHQGRELGAEIFNFRLKQFFK